MADRKILGGKEKSKGNNSKWLNRNVIGMALASFFSDAGHEAATAILPLFLISIGAPALALGSIEGIADAVSSFVKLASGWLSDRLHARKPIAVLGYFLTGLSTGVFALAQSWPFVLITRSIGWFGRGIRGPVRDAMLVESVDAKSRGHAFGFHRAGDTLGAICGPLFALLLVNVLAGKEATVLTYRQIFLLTMIPGLLSGLSFFWLVIEKRRSQIDKKNFFEGMHQLPIQFKRFLIGIGIFGAGDFAHSLLTLRAAQILTPVMGASAAGQVAIMLYILHNVFYAGASYPIGVLADRIGKRILLTAGYAIAAIMAVGWILAGPSILVLSVLFALGGIFIAAEDALEGALSADLLASGQLGTGYGTLATVNGLGDFISSIVVGFLWSTFSPAVGFGYAAMMFMIGALAIFHIR